MGGDNGELVKRWDSSPVRGCGHGASSTRCHPFQVKRRELAALPRPRGLHPLTRPKSLVAAKRNIDFTLG